MTGGIEVPWRQLSAEALQGVIEAFVLQEGTEYGEYEVSLVDKVSQVRAALQAGQAKLVFDPELEATTIVPVG